MIIELERCKIDFDATYHYIPGFDGDYTTPPEYDEVYIEDVIINKVTFPNTTIDSLWLEAHKDWKTMVECIVYDIVSDPDNEYYQKILELARSENVRDYL